MIYLEQGFPKWAKWPAKRPKQKFKGPGGA